MKKKWIAGLATVIVAATATTAWGDTSIRTYFNGERNTKIEVTASTLDMTQELITSLGGFATYDRETGKLFIDKPNVNIMVLEGVQQNKNNDIVLTNPVTGFLEKNIPRNFGVYVEVDNIIDAKDMSVKVNIIGPDGNVVDSSKEKSYSVRDGGFFFSQPFVSTKLKKNGTYKVQLTMKKEKDANMIVVGENSFTVGR
ncbi:hypothetical protein GOP56_09870 [Brevibacillus sp. 7WMA2]|uniref:Copper amine oxidase n=1 Tax=Brevibacillus laterosporus LMG 15441 TaxID=1042163 RepID=A0A075R5J9_BRELA|nr:MULTISPECIES: hypothetical protein [Brevibacillus]AIG27867.1 hypothetical protein BRLA_c035550 [Brevibacillus laterosporus LMG 15441]AUM66133.1 hypothetical protein C0R09_17210 [Brevibacillus laterosporus]AYK05078.1 hypothetical protein D8Z77_00800 [Brevibacillus laterosporus]ERM19239.1 hypothetical protein P615_10655 [Brevibacillus laterosporus PE36]MBA4533546.1 hypothetical protein [Brevibacillus halotolerans]